MAEIDVKWNTAELRRFFTGRTEPVARDLARRAVRVQNTAVAKASGHPHGYYRGVLYPSAPGEGPGVRTGRLRQSITWTLGEDAKGLYADVGASVGYAVYLEKGTSRMGAYPFLEPSLEAARG